MKYFYPIQITDLRHQVDHITPKNTQIFEDFSEDPANERLFLVLVRHRQVEMILDGNKSIEVKVIYTFNIIILVRISYLSSNFC